MDSFTEVFSTALKGGPGSGHFDHAGIPGHHGGSAPGNIQHGPDDIFYSFPGGIAGKNGNRLVAYQHIRRPGEKFSESEGIYGAKVSDFDRAQNCATCNRAIVHVYYVKDLQGEIKPYGSEHLHEALGYDKPLSPNQAQKLVNELEARHNSKKARADVLMKRISMSKGEANMLYNAANPGRKPDDGSVFMYHEDGRIIRVNKTFPDDVDIMSDHGFSFDKPETKGGKGSGHFEHAGRPGHRGGSAPSGTVDYSLSENFLEPVLKMRDLFDPEVTVDRANMPDGRTYRQTVFDTLKEYPTSDIIDQILNEGVTGKRDYSEVQYLDEFAWARANQDERALVKKEISLRISKLAGCDESVVSNLLGAWASTSNDHQYRSLSIQEAASEEFGSPLSDWQKGLLKEDKAFSDLLPHVDQALKMYPQDEYTDINREERKKLLAQWGEPEDMTERQKLFAKALKLLPVVNPAEKQVEYLLSKVPDANQTQAYKVIRDRINISKYVGHNQTPEEDWAEYKEPHTPVADRATERRILRAMYAETQSKMRMSSERYITLYRGIGTSWMAKQRAAKGSYTQAYEFFGSKITYHGNAIESWSVNPIIAENFGTVIAVRVPRKNIIATAKTGLGCLTEGEVIVTGMGNVKATVVYD